MHHMHTHKMAWPGTGKPKETYIVWACFDSERGVAWRPAARICRVWHSSRTPARTFFFPESPARCHDLEVFFEGAFLALSRLGLLYLALFGMWRLTAPGVFFQGFQDLGLLMIHHRLGLGTFQDVGAANFQDVGAATSAPMRYR